MTAPSPYASPRTDPATHRCTRCHRHSWECTCDGQRCTATYNGARCEKRPHAGTGHSAKHGAPRDLDEMFRYELARGR